VWCSRPGLGRSPDLGVRQHHRRQGAQKPRWCALARPAVTPTGSDRNPSQRRRTGTRRGCCRGGLAPIWPAWSRSSCLAQSSASHRVRCRWGHSTTKGSDVFDETAGPSGSTTVVDAGARDGSESDFSGGLPPGGVGVLGGQVAPGELGPVRAHDSGRSQQRGSSRDQLSTAVLKNAPLGRCR